MEKNQRTKSLTYSALAVALAVVLNQLTVIKMPQGGSVTLCSMLMIVLVGYWFGTKYGVIAGIAMGLINFMIGGYVVHWSQLLIDYPIAYGCLGFSGLLKNTKNLKLGYLLGVSGRYVCHIATGVIFFSMYAPEGQNALIYSVLYNGSYIIPEVVLTLILLSVPKVVKTLDRINPVN